MRTLTDIALEQGRLEKSFKYIRRERRNGRWRYWYEEPKHTDKEALKGGFGEKWKGYKGKPREAFEKLLKEQKGQIEDAFSINLPFFYRNDDGQWVEARRPDGSLILQRSGVDMVWGNRKINVGVDHIIDKHYQRFDHYHGIDEIINSIVDTTEVLNSHNGIDSSVYEVSTTDKGMPKTVIQLPNGNLMTVGSRVQKIGDREVIKHFILTAFEVDPDWRNKTNDKKTLNKRLKEQKKRRRK